MLRKVDENRILYKNESIGGAPQILKIYEHLSSRYLAVDWNISSQKDGGGIYICGRKILGYETPSMWILNPETLITRHPVHSDQVSEIVDEPVEEESYNLSN